ncbi:MAG: hypothetical protein WDA42_08305 [Candidatus Bathyarchaeia archaeon]
MINQGLSNNLLSSFQLAIIREHPESPITQLLLAHSDNQAELIKELRAERDMVMRALESLTPGGSEYVGDVARCVEHVLTVRKDQHELLKKYIRRAQRAEAKVQKALD